MDMYINESTKHIQELITGCTILIKPGASIVGGRPMPGLLKLVCKFLKENIIDN